MIDLFISPDNFLARIVALTGRAEETLGIARFMDTGDSRYWTLVVGEVEFRQILGGELTARIQSVTYTSCWAIIKTSEDLEKLDREARNEGKLTHAPTAWARMPYRMLEKRAMDKIKEERMERKK